MRSCQIVFFLAVLLPASVLMAQAATGAAEPRKPGPAVVAYLDGLYAATAAERPNPTEPKSKGLVKIRPLADDDETRARWECRAAAAIAPILGYDFLKLAVIQYYNDGERLTPLAGITIRHGFSDVIRQLPDGQPGVAEAKDAGELLWLSKHSSATFLVATTPAVIQEHTTAYLRKKVPASARVEEQSLAILNEYERACTIGVPPSKLVAIRRTGYSTMFESSGKVADLTGLPFEKVARLEGESPLLVINMLRQLPKGQPGLDAALGYMTKRWGEK